VGGVVSQTAAPMRDLETLLTRKHHYSILLGLLRTSGLLDQLKAEDQLTIFAPTNIALSRIPSNDFAALKSDAKRLTDLLTYHVTTEIAWHPVGMDNDKVFTSLNNNLPIRINYYYRLHAYAAEGINITERSQRFANGWLHGIDGVMMPPEGDVIDLIQDNPDLSMFAKHLTDAGLNDVIRADKNITVFAPNNAAFQKLNAGVLTYIEHSVETMKHILMFHVVERWTLYSIGMRHQMVLQTADRHQEDLLMLIESFDGDLDISVNNAKIVTKDISATNGVVHILEDVLIPTSVLIQIEDEGLGHHFG